MFLADLIKIEGRRVSELRLDKFEVLYETQETLELFLKFYREFYNEQDV